MQRFAISVLSSAKLPYRRKAAQKKNYILCTKCEMDTQISLHYSFCTALTVAKKMKICCLGIFCLTLSNLYRLKA